MDFPEAILFLQLETKSLRLKLRGIKNDASLVRLPVTPSVKRKSESVENHQKVPRLDNVIEKLSACSITRSVFDLRELGANLELPADEPGNSAIISQVESSSNVTLSCQSRETGPSSSTDSSDCSDQRSTSESDSSSISGPDQTPQPAVKKLVWTLRPPTPGNSNPKKAKKKLNTKLKHSNRLIPCQNLNVSAKKQSLMSEYLSASKIVDPKALD